jgi:hypothetical protein
MHVFLDSDVPHWMAVGGVFVDVGEAGGGGEGFFRNGNANLHDFHVRSLVLGEQYVADI